TTERDAVRRVAVVLMKDLQVARRRRSHERQCIDFAAREAEHADAFGRDREEELGAVGADAQAVGAEGRVELARLKPDLRLPTARRDAPDGRLERVGLVEITGLIEGYVVRQRRQIEERGRAGRGCGGARRQVWERRGIDRLLARADVYAHDSELRVDD